MLGDRAAPGMGRVAVAHYREVLETVGRGSVVSDVYRASMHDRVGALWTAYNDAADGAREAKVYPWAELRKCTGTSGNKACPNQVICLQGPKTIIATTAFPPLPPTPPHPLTPFIQGYTSQLSLSPS